jgi:hypothetical protein
MMDLQEIRDRVASIDKESGDDEAAHSNEDKLRADFIAHVAAHGNKKLSEMAHEVLKTDTIDFARWCA